MPRTSEIRPITYYGLSDIGLLRQNNEDIWHCVPEIALFLLADGMGGHQAGEIAAELAVAALASFVKSTPPSQSVKQAIKLLESGFEKANSSVHKKSQEQKILRGMGTTLCCILALENELIYGNIGDSRIYRFRQDKLEQLTKDHSLRNDWIAKGKIRSDQLFTFPHKNILTRAVGTMPQVQADILSTDLKTYDRILLCSDGLTDLVSDVEIAKIMQYQCSADLACKNLVELAKNQGGKDNITVVLIDF